MTFSSIVKNELSRTEIGNNCCAKAELAALVRTTGYISIKGFNKIEIELSTENAAVSRRIFKLLKILYNASTEVIVQKSNILKKRNIYIIKIEDDVLKKLLQDTMIIKGEEINLLDFDFSVPFEMLTNDCCKRSYIKGSFMGCGSISDPEKSYHAEFVNNKEEHSQGLCELINIYGINAKSIFRKNYFVSYIKESEQISDLLALMGASNSVLKFENVRVVKETRNRINRVINCETANLDKIVDTSMRQIKQIKVLKKYKAIDKLPDNLRELAYLRLKHNNASLKELGEMLDPPLGKSGVNHRLKKIEAIAEEILDHEKRGKKDEITKNNIKE
ncbi:MAG: DNA-binding protein WhiA [Tissierellia bacterium]|nr:DNA-binding protein WhiA [Tissierellia bacterium]MDD4779742.1 DNA-binding protein WhiA [Tissierellia bacterium]